MKLACYLKNNSGKIRGRYEVRQILALEKFYKNFKFDQ